MTPRGMRCAATPLEVTVPVVTSTLRPRALRRSISGSTVINSPTLAPCSHTSGPAGRATAVSPRRSPMRSSSSLPRASRRASSTEVSGSPATDSMR